jgi:hypothetical protein
VSYRKFPGDPDWTLLILFVVALGIIVLIRVV